MYKSVYRCCQSGQPTHKDEDEIQIAEMGKIVHTYECVFFCCDERHANDANTPLLLAFAWDRRWSAYSNGRPRCL
jgi:hypothetical protein